MRWEYKTIAVKRTFFTGAINVVEFQVQLNELGRGLGIGHPKSGSIS